MDNRERRDAGLAYVADGSVFLEMQECRKILQKLNFMDRTDFGGIAETVKHAPGRGGDPDWRQLSDGPQRGDLHRRAPGPPRHPQLWLLKLRT